MNFRAQAEMLVLFPKRTITADRDLTMPKRDWSRYDSPPDEVRKANVAKWKLDRARRGR
jgi:hypothetical protein